MLYEVAQTQAFVLVDSLCEVRFDYDKLIPCLVMLILDLSYLDILIDADLGKILKEHESIHKVCMNHFHSWHQMTTMQYIISKAQQFMGADAAFYFHRTKTWNDAVLRASNSIEKNEVCLPQKNEKRNRV
jgi:hypothetical protein